MASKRGFVEEGGPTMHGVFLGQGSWISGNFLFYVFRHFWMVEF